MVWNTSSIPLCNVNYDDSREREWNELRSDMEEFELDEDLKETKEANNNGKSY